MTISLFSSDVIDPLSKYLDTDDRSRLAEVSKEGYQKMNNTKIWQDLGLGDFIRDDKFWTMRKIFDLNPMISEEVIKTAMVELAKMIPMGSSGDFSLWERLEATAGEWCILLELFKRGAPFLPGEVRARGDGAAREVYGNALEAFMNKGNRPMVAFLLQTGIFFSDERHFKAIEAAKKKGCADIVDAWLQSYKDQSEEWLKHTVVVALRDKKNDLVKKMLCEPNATWSVWGLALRDAVENGQTEIVGFISPYIERIPETYYCWAKGVAEESHPDLLPLLERESEESRWVSMAMVAALVSFVVVVVFIDKSKIRKRFT